MNCFKSPITLFVACVISICPLHTVTAQTLSAEQMIEQLKTKPSEINPAAGRTRSLRNLKVESSSDQGSDAPAVKPSLSLLIQFDFDSSRVRPESQQALMNLATALKSDQLKASKFAVEGHTDAKGRADYNLRLSGQRAAAVKDFLSAQGVSADRLGASGKGSSELANKDEPHAAENRRVRIVNLD